MPDVTVNIEVFCGNCGAGICNLSDGSDNSNRPSITVQLCENCIKDIKTEAYNEGYDNGFKDGKEAAYAA